MRKNIIKIVFVVIALALVYWVYQSIMSHETPDETFILLENLKQETKIDFLEMGNFELKWIAETGSETIIRGKGFQVIGAPKEKLDDIISFLKGNGFKVDINNVADGNFSWLRGYIKDKDICVVIEKITGYGETENQKILPDIGKRDVFIRCGKLD